MKNVKKKFRITLIVGLVLTAGAIGAYYVIAQTVTDIFDNDNKIASVWNISTSTSGQIQLATRECDVLTWHCSASTTCANYIGDGDYIIMI